MCLSRDTSEKKTQKSTENLVCDHRESWVVDVNVTNIYLQKGIKEINKKGLDKIPFPATISCI